MTVLYTCTNSGRCGAPPPWPGPSRWARRRCAASASRTLCTPWPPPTRIAGGTHVHHVGRGEGAQHPQHPLLGLEPVGPMRLVRPVSGGRNDPHPVSRHQQVPKRGHVVGDGLVRVHELGENVGHLLLGQDHHVGRGEGAQHPHLGHGVLNGLPPPASLEELACITSDAEKVRSIRSIRSTRSWVWSQ